MKQIPQLRRVIIATLSLCLLASTVFGQAWIPSKLELSIGDVYYLLDTFEYSIDLTVSGTPARVVLCVFSNNVDDDIIDIQNGYLGWHYVNKVDTCVYYTTCQDMSIGTHTIYWDGYDMDGYFSTHYSHKLYFFGYDNINPKQQAASIISIGMGRHDRFVTHGFKGQPYPQPILYTDPFGGMGGTDEPIRAGDDTTRDGYLPGEYVNRMKFIIGSDPDDPSNIEKTWYDVFFERSQFEPSPYEHDMFFISTNNTTEYKGAIRKYRWVPNGESEPQTDWGYNGKVSWSIMTDGSWWVRFPTCFSYISNDQLIGCNADISGFSTEAELIRVDAIEGYEIDRINLADWWIRPQDCENGGQQSSGPCYAQFRVVNGEPRLCLSSHTSCILNVINPHDEDGDWQRWINQNGDYIADRNWEPDSDRPWLCNDYNYPARTYMASIDDNGFVVSTADKNGAKSFNLFAPDGTGINSFAFAGETIGYKYATHLVHYDSPYDGIYCDNESADPNSTEWNESVGGVWYIPYDSVSIEIEGPHFPPYETIRLNVEETPYSFTVEQNSPNPFNPATTINFSLAEAGNVSIDIYNTAGQKIDTLADGFMEAGSHSVVWDASHVAAGIYFYTVTSGAYSKTMKMTLMK